MWFGTLTVALTLSCNFCLSYASECPDLGCSAEIDCGIRGTPYDTHFYIGDNTCSGCKKCVYGEPLPGRKCPMMACEMWSLSRTCNPVFYTLFINYKGEECNACQTYRCTGQA